MDSGTVHCNPNITRRTMLETINIQSKIKKNEKENKTHIL